MKSFKLTSKTGKVGEAVAKKYLISKGHVILAENYYYEFGPRRGEIDIISRESGIIRFVEVKTRLERRGLVKSGNNDYPIEAQVTREKIKKCSKAASRYLETHDLQNQEHHFDVITVLYNEKEKKAQIKYLKDVFY